MHRAEITATAAMRLPSRHPSDVMSEVALMVRAHEKWVAAGRPKGNGEEFWSAAQQEVRPVLPGCK